MHRTLTLVLVASLALPCDAAEPRTRVVALTGDSVDGLPAAETLTVLGDHRILGIDSEGNTLFDGFVRAADGARLGYFLGTRGTLRPVVLQGDAAPAGNGIAIDGRTIAGLQDAVLDPDGNVRLAVNTTDGAVQRRLLAAEIGGELQAFASAFSDVPGHGLLTRVGNGILENDWSFGGNTFVFPAESGMSGAGILLRRRVGAPAETLATESASAPGIADGAYHGPFIQVVSNAAGDVLFEDRVDVDPVDRRTLFFAPAGQSPRPLSSREFAIEGTDQAVASVETWTFGPGTAAQGGARVVYVVNGANTPLSGGSNGREHYVIDTAHGGAPILSTGTQLGEFTFSPMNSSLAFSTTIQVAAARDGKVVIVGDTTGPRVRRGEDHAVWRFDPAADPQLEVVLFEGGPVPGLPSESRTVDQLLTVNVSATGEIAAEVRMEGGDRAILLEERTQGAATRFRMPITQRGTFEAPGGPYEVLGLIDEFPSVPRLRGPGGDGRQTRFSPDNEFVFHGRVRSDDHPSGVAGVFVTTVEEEPEACEIDVRRRGRNLFVTADDGGCRLTVQVAPGGAYTFHPGEDVRINGEDDVFMITAPGNLRIRMGAGDDVLQLLGSSDDTEHVGGNVDIDLGGGEDGFFTEQVNLRGSMTLRGGSGPGDLLLQDLDVGRNLRVDVAPDTALTLERVAAPGKATFQLGGGPAGAMRMTDCTYGKTKIRGGPGDDALDFTDVSFSGKSKIDFGPGAQQSLRWFRGTTQGNLSISGRKGLHTEVVLDEVEVTRGNLVVPTGRGGCLVDLIDVHVGKRAQFTTAGTETNASVNFLRFTDVDVDRALAIRGQGSHEVRFVGANDLREGLAVNLRGGAADLLSIRGVNVQRGLLQISSRALGAVRGDVTGCTVAGNGALSIRTGNGDDDLVVERCDVGGRLQVTLDRGDDVVRVNDSRIGRDLRLFGGDGEDRLGNGDIDVNTVSGDTVEDSFEGPAVNPPSLEVDDGPPEGS